MFSTALRSNRKIEYAACTNVFPEGVPTIESSLSIKSLMINAYLKAKSLIKEMILQRADMRCDMALVKFPVFSDLGRSKP